jgi:hypothetical protein
VQKFHRIIVIVTNDGRNPMDWLFTDENTATAIVIAGFCLLSLASGLSARRAGRPLRRDGRARQRQPTMPSARGVK